MGKPDILFLDIDGVLNKRKPMRNGYCGIEKPLVSKLAVILKALPHLKIVISSSWRYMIAKGVISLKGFEYLLIIHGMDWELINDRIIDHTETDKFPPGTTMTAMMTLGSEVRSQQVIKWVDTHSVRRYVALDDDDLPKVKLVKTDGNSGLTSKQVKEIVSYFVP